MSAKRPATASRKPGQHEAGRALDVHEGDAVDESRLASWIRQAVDLPGWGSS